MKISIIILNWNREKDTIECLKSIKKLKFKKGWTINVIIVDNASQQSSIDKISRYINKSFKTQKNLYSRIILNKDNLGFASGNNVGIDYAIKNESDYILVLNNDTEVDKMMLVGLIDVALRYPKAGAISPKIYFAKGYEFHKNDYKKNESGKVIWYAGGKIDWGNVYGSNRGVDEVDAGKFMDTEPTDFATGACVLFRKQALNEVGYFDSKYFMYFEDADLSMRMKKKGWMVLYTPEAYLWHKVAQSSGIGSDLNDYFITRNRMLFGMKYAPIRTRFALYRESLKLYWMGREWQKQGIKDFYLGRFGKGSWNNKR